MCLSYVQHIMYTPICVSIHINIIYIYIIYIPMGMYMYISRCTNWHTKLEVLNGLCSPRWRRREHLGFITGVGPLRYQLLKRVGGHVLRSHVGGCDVRRTGTSSAQSLINSHLMCVANQQDVPIPSDIEP